MILVFSACARTPNKPPTNYTAKFGPAAPDDAPSDDEPLTPFMPRVVLDPEKQLDIDDVFGNDQTQEPN